MVCFRYIVIISFYFPSNAFLLSVSMLCVWGRIEFGGGGGDNFSDNTLSRFHYERRMASSRSRPLLV